MNTVYLTRRNLLTLLNKLDRVKAGGESACAIIKHDTEHKKYPCSIATIVAAVEDDDYYNDRSPGSVWPDDEPQ